MEQGEQVSLWQHIKIKSPHPPYFVFNRQMGTVVGFLDGQAQVRPDSDLSRILELYPHEIRDTNPPQEAPPHIRMAISELASFPQELPSFNGGNPQQL